MQEKTNINIDKISSKLQESWKKFKQKFYCLKKHY